MDCRISSSLSLDVVMLSFLNIWTTVVIIMKFELVIIVLLLWLWSLALGLVISLLYFGLHLWKYFYKLLMLFCNLHFPTDSWWRHHRTVAWLGSNWQWGVLVHSDTWWRPRTRFTWLVDIRSLRHAP